MSLMAKIAKIEIIIVPKGTKYTGSGKLGLTEILTSLLSQA